MNQGNKILGLPLSIIILALSSCTDSKEVKVTVEAENMVNQSYMIELNAKEIIPRLNSSFFYITDSNGNEIPSQLTYDSLLIFKTPIVNESSATFKILPSDTLHTYPDIVFGQFYPSRRDDITYENNLGGYRIYGPGTQKAGEKSFGYDIPRFCTNISFWINMKTEVTFSSKSRTNRIINSIFIAK